MPRRAKTRTASKVITGRVRVEVIDQREAAGDSDLLDFPCACGARTGEQKRAADEVVEGFNLTYAGRPEPLMVAKVSEEGGGLIVVAVVAMTGDHSCARRLTVEPYIEAIARHDDYRHCLLRDHKTSAGTIVLRAAVEMVLLEHPTSEIVARVLFGNRSSHAIFSDLGFDHLERSAFFPPTEQVIRLRQSGTPLPAPLDASIYERPRQPCAASSQGGRRRTGRLPEQVPR